MMMKRILIASLAGLALAAQAQTLTGATMEPAQIQAGQKSTLKADFDISSGALNCNVRVTFGDGSPEQHFKINQTQDVPLVAEHVYAKPGQYTVRVEPRTKMPVLKCTGGDKQVQVKVSAAASPAAKTPAAAPAAAAPACPEGWRLDRKSLNKKTGAYTCAAKAGTPAPAGKLDCPGSLGYFENPKKGQLGCRP